MKKIGYLIGSGGIFLLPLIALGQADTGLLTGETDGGEFGILLKSILDFTNAYLIPFIIGIGFLTFVWGMFQYFIAGGANDEAKDKGKSLMIYAVLGFVLIIVFWGIVNLIAASIGGGGTVITPPTVKPIS